MQIAIMIRYLGDDPVPYTIEHNVPLSLLLFADTNLENIQVGGY